jgi:ABC-type nitrate/sulfonate/bicarbonate transport system permease component
MKRLRNIENSIIPAVFFVVLLIIWQLSVDMGAISRTLLPAPTDVGSTLVEILPSIHNHILVTMMEAFTGFLLSILLALVLAILMDSVKLIKKAVYPILLVSQTVPLIVLAPLFVMWFGYGMLPKIIVVVLVCFFPILISLLDGLSSVDKDIVNLLKSMKASRLQIFRLVKFPGAMVSFFSGLRIAATYSIMGAVIGEWMGGRAGLGIYMTRVRHSFAYDKTFAAIVVIVILSMLVFYAVKLLQKLIMPWSIEIEKNRR